MELEKTFCLLYAERNHIVGIKVGIYDLPQIVISQLCVRQTADEKTDKRVFIPFHIPLTKIQFDEISKLEFKKSKLCLQSKKGKPASKNK